MKQIAVTVTFLLSFFVLAACSSSPEMQAQQVQQQKEKERMTVVSSAAPADVLPAFKTFTWNEDYNRVLSAVNGKEESEIKAYIRRQLITYLNSKGYRYQPDPAQADVVFGFLFALEDDIADQTIQDKFGLVPGLNNRAVNNLMGLREIVC